MNMKQILLLAFLTLTTLSFSQKIKLKVNGQKDTTVFLIKYYGKNLLYADTAEMKGGLVEFDGRKQKPGIVGLLLPGQKYFEFIYNNEEIQLETTGPDFVNNMKVKKSAENMVFVDYIKYINSERQKANDLVAKRDALKKTDEAYKTLSAEIDTISKKVIAYQNKVVNDNTGKLVSKVVKMSMDVKVPEAPKNADGSPVDSNFAYHYFRDHFFDNFDLTDDRLVNTPIFHSKLDYFFSQNMLIQHPDTIVKYAYWFCDKLNPKSEMFKYAVIHITSTFEKSKIMGMDKVFVKMGEKYYCSKNAEGKSPAFWMAEDKLKDLCEKVNTNKVLVQGVRPPNISLRDTTDVNWRDFYSIKADYTILYFWESDCGHCKKSTPKLQKLYEEKLKARNVEIFGVSKGIDEDFGKWKKFIKDNKLTYINVALTNSLFRAAQENALQFIPKYTTLEALNYQETYDVVTTPRVFILDKDKKIIGKGLSIAQLEDFMDKIQGFKDAPKIIEPDPEDTGH
jgi:thiol-disulfide isomerase/thioredoxin